MIAPAQPLPYSRIKRQRRKSYETNASKFEWRSWGSVIEDALPQVKKRFKLEASETTEDIHVIIKGRFDKRIMLKDGERLVIARMDEKGDHFEKWTPMINAKLPLHRPMAVSISRMIPRLGASCVTASTPQELIEDISKKNQVYSVNKSRKIWKNGPVTARISKMKVDGKTLKSLTLESESESALYAELEALGLTRAANENVIDRLFAM